MQLKITEISMSGIKVYTDGSLIEMEFVCVCEREWESPAVWNRMQFVRDAAVVSAFNHTDEKQTKPPTRILRPTEKTLLATRTDTNETHFNITDTFLISYTWKWQNGSLPARCLSHAAPAELIKPVPILFSQVFLWKYTSPYGNVQYERDGNERKYPL